MGIVESTGGRKWWLAVIPIMTLCAVLLILAIRNALSDKMLIGIGSVITALKGLFDWSNTANNKAALAAGKVAEDEAQGKLDAMPDADVLDAASKATGVDVGGIVASTTDAAVERLRSETARAIEELRAIAQGIQPGSSGGGK